MRGFPAPGAPPQVNSLIAAGQWWRLVTPVLLHADPLHLGMNANSLNQLGPWVEQQAGGKRTLAIYLLSGIAGVVASYIFNPSPALGASGTTLHFCVD